MKSCPTTATLIDAPVLRRFDVSAECKKQGHSCVRRRSRPIEAEALVANCRRSISPPHKRRLPTCFGARHDRALPPCKHVRILSANRSKRHSNLLSKRQEKTGENLSAAPISARDSSRPSSIHAPKKYSLSASGGGDRRRLAIAVRCVGEITSVSWRDAFTDSGRILLGAQRRPRK